ncbi:hypothetical protein ACXR2T_06270 [Leucobacter sp. HY1910]
MNTKFRGLKVRPYEFRQKDGNTRPVLAFYAGGGKPIAFIEFDAARGLVDAVHDACDAHEQLLREADK